MPFLFTYTLQNAGSLPFSVFSVFSCAFRTSHVNSHDFCHSFDFQFIYTSLTTEYVLFFGAKNWMFSQSSLSNSLNTNGVTLTIKRSDRFLTSNLPVCAGLMPYLFTYTLQKAGSLSFSVCSVFFLRFPNKSLEQSWFLLLVRLSIHSHVTDDGIRSLFGAKNWMFSQSSLSNLQDTDGVTLTIKRSDRFRASSFAGCRFVCTAETSSHLDSNPVETFSTLRMVEWQAHVALRHLFVVSASVY
jgi:hypothetical protein